MNEYLDNKDDETLDIINKKDPNYGGNYTYQEWSIEKRLTFTLNKNHVIRSDYSFYDSQRQIYFKELEDIIKLSEQAIKSIDASVEAIKIWANIHINLKTAIEEENRIDLGKLQTAIRAIQDANSNN